MRNQTMALKLHFQEQFSSIHSFPITAFSCTEVQEVFTEPISAAISSNFLEAQVLISLGFLCKISKVQQLLRKELWARERNQALMAKGEAVTAEGKGQLMTKMIRTWRLNIIRTRSPNPLISPSSPLSLPVLIISHSSLCVDGQRKSKS